METINETTNNKVVKTIKCEKCGAEFDANFIRCPKCGHNRFMKLAKYIVVALLVAAILFINIFTLVRVNQINDYVISGFDYTQYQFETLQNGLFGTGETASANQYDISTNAYYQGRELTGVEDLSTLGNDYIIYFHQHDCGACNELNVFLKSYVESSNVENTPIWFVTPDTGNALFDNKLFGENGVTETPEMFRMSNGEIVESAVGVQNCINLINKCISDYQ